MAYYSESGYCSEDVRRRPYAEPGYHRCGEGGERYAVRKEYEEIDEVARAGRPGHHHHHGQYDDGHLGRSGSHHHHHDVHGGGHLGGEYREQHHGHGGRHYDACESKRYDSCTGQYYA